MSRCLCATAMCSVFRAAQVDLNQRCGWRGKGNDGVVFHVFNCTHLPPECVDTVEEALERRGLPCRRCARSVNVFVEPMLGEVDSTLEEVCVSSSRSTRFTSSRWMACRKGVEKSRRGATLGLSPN